MNRSEQKRLPLSRVCFKKDRNRRKETALQADHEFINHHQFGVDEGPFHISKKILKTEVNGLEMKNAYGKSRDSRQ